MEKRPAMNEFNTIWVNGQQVLMRRYPDLDCWFGSPKSYLITRRRLQKSGLDTLELDDTENGNLKILQTRRIA